MEKKSLINLDHAKETLCKNIMIFGYCKYEGKGCAFRHSIQNVPSTTNITNNSINNTPSTPTATNQSSSRTSSNFTPPSSSHDQSNKKKFNLDSPAFMPSLGSSSVNTLSNKFSKMSPTLSNIQTFIPGSISSATGDALSSPLTASKSSAKVDEKKFNAETPAFTPSGSVPSINPYANNNESNQMMNPYTNSQSSDVFYQQPTFPLQYHLYAPAPPPRLQIPLNPHEDNAQTMFISNNLREILQRKNEATLQTFPQSKLPDFVHHYHSLVPIDTSMEKSIKSFGYPTTLYKAFSNVDGNAYTLRKIDNIRLTNEKSLSKVKAWSSVRCANVVQLQEAFTTVAFGSNSLIIVYDFFPCSNTLIEQHINRKLGGKLQPITEDLLWSYICQITNALVNIHEKNLAVRVLDLSKIIVTNKNRIRLSGCGVLDIVNFESDENSETSIETLQREDIASFSKVMLELASLTLPVSGRYGPPEKVISSLAFSDDFKNALIKLNEKEVSLTVFCESIASKMLKVMNNLEDANDFFEGQMTTELENSRLVRLLTKLGFINERPEHDHDPSWSETGDRYPLKLFRDYVFHQVDETGKPVVDLSHVLACLNKLDAGVEEKILLVSRDEKSCIIVSYKELRDLIDSAFRDLTRDQ